MKIVLSNAFSLNMLCTNNTTIKISSVDNPAELINGNVLIDNIIGHKDTDNVVRNYLEKDGCYIPKGERKTFKWDEDCAILVAQYKGERLPEGCKELPSGSRIDWLLVETGPIVV